jgi:peptide/nickel transport system substrate-binding protein
VPTLEGGYPINNPTVMERNPFFYEVDTAGNQLPYIDRIQMTVAENLEVLNLRAIAGQYDLQERHTAMTKLPVFLENRDKVGYDVRLDPALNGSDATLQINHAYDADPEIAKWLLTADFRRALSMGMTRPAERDVLARIGTPGPSPRGNDAVQPGAGWRKKWSTLDVNSQRAPRQDRPSKDGEGIDSADGKGRRASSS